ncbi:OmpH family outer membrane protein [bacterium AH-315-I18]|nr:OmpH family outer membrane protein [Phycisphaeraceae bacterium]MBN4060869.1 OmpH family outer membrane protein [bacterium AH-315-I18]
MQRIKLMSLVWGIALMGLMSIPTQVQAQARPTSIAVLDVEKAMNALEEMTQLEADLKTQIEQVKQEHETRRNKLQQMQEDLELLQQGTDAYMQKAEEFQLFAMQLESWMKYKQARMGSERIIQIGNMYRKMTDTIAKIASESGYDMVMYKEKAPSFGNLKPEAMRAYISLRKVLWVRQDMDITDQVVLRINNEWKNRH